MNLTLCLIIRLQVCVVVRRLLVVRVTCVDRTSVCIVFGLAVKVLLTRCWVLLVLLCVSVRLVNL